MPMSFNQPGHMTGSQNFGNARGNHSDVHTYQFNKRMENENSMNTLNEEKNSYMNPGFKMVDPKGNNRSFGTHNVNANNVNPNSFNQAYQQPNEFRKLAPAPSANPFSPVHDLLRRQRELQDQIGVEFGNFNAMHNNVIQSEASILKEEAQMVNQPLNDDLRYLEVIEVSIDRKLELLTTLRKE